MLAKVFSLAWLGLQVPQVVPVNREPQAAEQVLEFHARCPGIRVDIRSVGLAIPRIERSSIRLNARSLRGPGSGLLATDLAHRRAVYRLVPLCNETQDGLWYMQLLIFRSRIGPDGAAIYELAEANFSSRGLIAYEAMRPTEPNGFLF